MRCLLDRYRDAMREYPEARASDESRHFVVIGSLGHERAITQSEYETKRTEAVERQEGDVRFFDEVKDRDHFRRVFSTWDFSQFAR